MPKITDEIRRRIDGWCEAHCRNEFGDPADTVYAGGTPLFNERTGEMKDRYEYILEHHPEAACHGAAGDSQ